MLLPHAKTAVEQNFIKGTDLLTVVASKIDRQVRSDYYVAHQEHSSCHEFQ